MVDSSTENEYTINLRFKVCMESAFECNRDIEILRNHVVKRQCDFGPNFQIPGTFYTRTLSFGLDTYLIELKKKHLSVK